MGLKLKGYCLSETQMQLGSLYLICSVGNPVLGMASEAVAWTHGPNRRGGMGSPVMPISLCRQRESGPASEESDEGNLPGTPTQHAFQQALADHLVYYQRSPLASISVSLIYRSKEIVIHGPNR